MPQSQRGQFGSGSLLVVLALTAGSAAAEALPALRVNPGLLGAGTPPPSAPVAAEVPAAPKELAALPVPVASSPTVKVDLAPQQGKPVQQVAVPVPVVRAAPASKPAQAPVPAAPASVAPPLPVTPPSAVIAATRREEAPKEAAPAPAAAVVGSIQKPPQPPQVEERPALPPLYSAHVAAGELPDPALRPAAGVMPYLKQPGELLPTFIVADHIAGKNDVEVVADGSVELRKRNSILQSDRLTYRQDSDEVDAEGNVRLSRDGDRVRGPRMRMKLDDSTGFFEQPEYSIRRIKTNSAATLWTGTEERVSSEAPFKSSDPEKP